MANFSKSFNFRGGFQVDTDVLVVRGQNVGIGSSIPTERLDVDGIVKAEGLLISGSDETVLDRVSAGVLTVTETLDVGIETGSGLSYPDGTPQVRITTGIITAANPTIGVVTYYGDGGRLLNLPTSQWLDVDVGLGFTSIYAQGYVGVDTTDPRYVFQVGGVPFAPKAGFLNSQPGVGIEGGSIYASGIITAGVNISAGATVYAGREFIGVGSNITVLNADNIAIGSIGSMRYGDTIVTKEVIANNFTGIASFAVDVLPDSDLVYESGRANTITAVSRFITTEGGISVGHNDPPSANLGDIDVNRESGDSVIYSVTADNATGKIFAGHEREGGVRNGFGGIRFGGNVTGSPTSGANDLDVVNYDVGNLNFVLHDGNTAGGTSGQFRWIYGQFDTIPMTLDQSGKLTLTGNLTPTNNTLEVAGLSSFLNDVTIDGDFSVLSNTVMLGDLSIGGELSFGTISIGATFTAPGIVVEDKLVVGTEGGAGVVINSDGTAVISESLTVVDVLINNTGITVSGGAISASNASFTNATITDLTTTDISANGFTVNSGTTVIDTLVANNISGTIPSISAQDITVINLAATNITGDTGDIETITCESITVDGLTTTEDLTVSNTLDVLTANISNLNLSSSLSLNALDVGSIDNVTPGADVDFQVGINVSGNGTFVGGDVTADNVTAGIVSASTRIITSQIKAAPVASDIFMSFFPGTELDPPDSSKVVLVFVNQAGTELGRVTLDYDT